jgi:leucyl-tRNA synthetase
MRHALETVVLLLSPIVPHFSEELWQTLGARAKHAADALAQTP